MARQGYPSDKQAQFVVRLPDGLRDRIKAAADAANQSMNSIIVETLEERFPLPFGRDETRKMIKAYLRTLGDDPTELPVEDFARAEKFIHEILVYALEEKDPEEALNDISNENIDISDVMMERFVQWRREMANLVALRSARTGDGSGFGDGAGNENGDGHGEGFAEGAGNGDGSGEG